MAGSLSRSTSRLDLPISVDELIQARPPSQPLTFGGLNKAWPTPSSPLANRSKLVVIWRHRIDSTMNSTGERTFLPRLQSESSSLLERIFRTSGSIANSPFWNSSAKGARNSVGQSGSSNTKKRTSLPAINVGIDRWVTTASTASSPDSILSLSNSFLNPESC